MKKHLRLILVSIPVLALIGVSLVPKDTFPSTTDATSEEERQERLAGTRAKINDLAEATANEQAADTATTVRRVKAMFDHARSRSGHAASQAAASFQGFGNVSWCVTVGAKDKLFGNHELVDYITRSMSPVTGLLAAVEREMKKELSLLQQRSTVRANSFQIASLKLADDAGLSLPEIGFDPARIGSLAQKASDSMTQISHATLGVALEAIFIKWTVQSVLAVVEQLIAREAASLGAGAACAAADGPFPIGDIIGAVIAVGGTLWTAAEVYAAVESYKALPGQVCATLHEQLDTLDRKCTEYLEALTPSFAPLYTLNQ